MSSWIISALLAIGVAVWSYNKLARANGNASPRSNLTIAAAAGAIIFVVLLSLLTLVFNF